MGMKNFKNLKKKLQKLIEKLFEIWFSFSYNFFFVFLFIFSKKKLLFNGLFNYDFRICLNFVFSFGSFYHPTQKRKLKHRVNLKKNFGIFSKSMVGRFCATCCTKELVDFV